MTEGTRYTTSPLFFVHPESNGARAVAAGHGQRFQRLSLDAFRVLDFFLTPATLSEAEEAGFGPDELDEAVTARLLLAVDDPVFEAVKLWEDRRWSRAAYLLFSQLDLDYTEPVDEELPQPELIALRRETIRQYQSEALYPERHRVADPHPLVLPRHEDRDRPDLDSIVARRSARAFGENEIDLNVFSQVLFYSTRNVRLAHDSQSAGDPFYLLNSFYSWLEIYVAVQGVEHVDRGLYQYDPLQHQLLHIRPGLKDEEVSATIQHQYWIGGGGFCLFIGVHWERYMWLYRHSRAYVNLVIQLGEYGQEALQAAYSRDLVGWMTPAVTESAAAELLGLDPLQRDVMYFLKLGPPQPSEEGG